MSCVLSRLGNLFDFCYFQTWLDNMGKTKEPTITDSKNEDFTCVTFYPDLPKFKMTILDKDTVALFTRRAYDIAATSKGVKVVLNGQRLNVCSKGCLLKDIGLRWHNRDCQGHDYMVVGFIATYGISADH